MEQKTNDLIYLVSVTLFFLIILGVAAVLFLKSTSQPPPVLPVPLGVSSVGEQGDTPGI